MIPINPVNPIHMCGCNLNPNNIIIKDKYLKKYCMIITSQE